MYVVNRRTVASESRTITLTFNNNSSALAVVDIVAGTNSVVPANGSYQTVLLTPGEGRLLMVGSPPAAPQNLYITNTTCTPIHLSWDASAGPNLTGYEVSRLVENWPAIWTAIANPTSNSYTDNEYIWADGAGNFRNSYKVRARNSTGFLSDYSNIAAIRSEENGERAKDNELASSLVSYTNSVNQNNPNPFNPSTRISFSLADESYVTIEVFDILGRKIQTLAKNLYSKGLHELQFDGSRLPSGTYLYKLQAVANGTGSVFVRIQKMVLAK